MSSFDSWSDSHLISPSHLHGVDVAEMIEPPGCAAFARTGRCGQDVASQILGKGFREVSPPSIMHVRGICGE